MTVSVSRYMGAGVFFALIFVTGFVLSRSGKPYGAVLFNTHKFIALGALVFLIVTINQARKAAPLGPLATAALVLAGLCFAATIVTGGLGSVERPTPAAMTVLHKVLPYLTALSSAGALYGLAR